MCILHNYRNINRNTLAEIRVEYCKINFLLALRENFILIVQTNVLTDYLNLSNKQFYKTLISTVLLQNDFNCFMLNICAVFVCSCRVSGLVLSNQRKSQNGLCVTPYHDPNLFI